MLLCSGVYFIDPLVVWVQLGGSKGKPREEEQVPNAALGAPTWFHSGEGSGIRPLLAFGNQWSEKTEGALTGPPEVIPQDSWASFLEQVVCIGPCSCPGHR